MAILKSGNLSFEIVFSDYDSADWVQYQFYFRWDDEPLVRDDLLKKQGPYWGTRPKGAFLANEDEADGLIPLLRNALETGTADYWEPLEPDIIVAIYPGQYFPFLKHRWQVLRESEECAAEREEREKRKAEQPQQPDDLFSFIAMVDAYNFKEAEGYYGEGLSLHLVVERRELEKFVADLQQEYQEFCEKFGVGRDRPAQAPPKTLYE